MHGEVGFALSGLLDTSWLADPLESLATGHLHAYQRCVPGMLGCTACTTECYCR
jgi:hypothetical protein